MEMKVMSIVKLIVVVIVGLFVFKMASKYMASKFPNVVTNAVDTVVQGA